MSTTTARFILQRLTEWGIKRIYGYPGDGINGLMGAWHGMEDELDFVQTRHEEIAAFAACAHAKFTGEVGVCMATSGPGAVHLLNGLYDAKLDHQPVLAIVGQQARSSLGSNYQQEIDLDSLFKDVASQYVQTCMVPAQAAHLIDRALRTAKATRSPTCLIIPNDVQEAEYTPPPRKHGRCSRPSPDRRAPRASRPGAAAPGGRHPQRRRARGDPDRPGRRTRRPRWSRRPSCSARGWPRRSTAARCSPTTCPT